MSIIGHGVDLVEIARIEQMLEKHEERFLERCFTVEEYEYAVDGGRRRAERLSARFAAKEAALKALGTGWRNGIAWTDIEVRREPSGQPTLKLSGEALRVAEKLGITRWLVSLTHTDTHAMASVIGVRD